MPMPTEDRVSRLVAALVSDRGYDLEGVRITAAGARSTVQVLVDDDRGVDLDALAELSTEVSQALDESGDFGERQYTLEVTTPGVDRPLTLPRHWRRAQGRKVRFTAAGQLVVGRIGAVDENGPEPSVAVVLPGKPEPTVTTVLLAEVADAVVQVEFSPPDPRELSLAGGIAAGRPVPGSETIPTTTAEGH